jgi:hypothetical protein
MLFKICHYYIQISKRLSCMVSDDPKYIFWTFLGEVQTVAVLKFNMKNRCDPRLGRSVTILLLCNCNTDSIF